MANDSLVDKTTPIPEMFIYDEIGPSWAGMIDDKLVLEGLNELGKQDVIRVRINSPGGDVFIGNSIYSALRRSSARILVSVDSLAASIASLIAMAGDEIEIAETGFMMIHRSWTIALGDRNELLKTVELLDKIDTTLVDTYATRATIDRDEIEQLVDAETWMTANEAVSRGFADTVAGKSDAKAVIPEHLKFRNIPKRLTECVEQRTYMRRRGRGFPERDSSAYPNLAAAMASRDERRSVG